MILTKEGIDYYYLFDIESGAPYRVSKEYYEWYNKQVQEIFEHINTKLDSPHKGVLIVGTAGDFENNNNFKEIFYNPDNWNIKSFDNTWEETKAINYFKPAHMAREFKQPEPLKDNDLMPMGKYKGDKMEDVPAKYLLYMYENFDDLHLGVKQYIENNLDVIKQQAKSE